MKALLDLGFKVPYATAKYAINLNYIKNVKEQNLEDRYKVCFSVKPFLSCKYSTSQYIHNLQIENLMCCFSSCRMFQWHVAALHVLYQNPLGCVMHITIRS